MAASSSSQPDHHHARPATSHRQETKPKRQHHIRPLNVQVPSAATAGWFGGCFRTSPMSTPASASNADRPASPSLIRSPSAWIRARGQSFASSRHARRRSGDFQYDARSYARNFDEGADGSGDDELTWAEGDALNYRCFSSRLPASPPTPASPAAWAGHNGKNMAKETACETGHVLE